MRVHPWLTGLLLTAAVGACHKPPAGAGSSAQVALAPEAPAASGLWVQRVSDHRRIAVTRYCLDARAAQQLAAFSHQLSNRCLRRNMAQAADGSWRFSTQCDMGAWGAVATDGVVEGDFARHYRIEARAQAAGATRPSANGARRVLADISWQGACPRSMKPGDIVWPGGRRSRLADLAAPS
jgi:hypothetical protein